MPGSARTSSTAYEALARAGKFNLRSYAMIYGGKRHERLPGPATGARTPARHCTAAISGCAPSRSSSTAPWAAGVRRCWSRTPTIPATWASSGSRRSRWSGSRCGRCRPASRCATHAIGDRANRVALDIYASALRQVPTANHRFRDRACAAAHAAGHSALRRARGDSLDAGKSPDQRHVLGREPDRAGPGPVGLCVAIAAQYRRDHSQRLRRSGGVDQPAGLVPFLHHAAGRRQQSSGRLVPGTASHARGGAARHDTVAGVRRHSWRTTWEACRWASTPTS